MVDITKRERTHSSESRESGRVEAFSDGVFAIAVTLLVLEIRVPLPEELAGKGLGAVLLQQWPMYLAYMFSFRWILVMWTAHHNLFKKIQRVDQIFLLINGLLLMAITLVPFPTGLLAEYIRLSEQDSAVGNQRLATLIYSGLALVISILFDLLSWYASGRLITQTVGTEYKRHTARHYILGPALFFSSFLLAFVSVWLSLLIYVGLLVFYAFPTGVMLSHPRLRE